MKVRKEKIYQYETVFEADAEEGGYTVTVPKLPGLVTEGDNIKEAREMTKDAIKCYIEALLKDEEFYSHKTSTLRREEVSIKV